jgi:addiction module HigA family antidote
MIVGYRDKRTADFAAGKRVKAFSGIARRTSRLSIITEEHTMAARAIHPGEHLAEELEALAMSAAELARRLKVPTNRVTAILNGQRAISGDTALRLAHFFGTSPQFWLNLQSLYEIRLAEEKSGKAIKKLPSLKRVAEVHA